MRKRLKYLIFLIYYLSFFNNVVISNNIFAKTGSNNNIVNSYSSSRLPKYVLGPGDKLIVKIYKFENFNSEVTILPDGTISLPRINSLKLNNLTLDQARELITTEYKKILKNPLIYINLEESRPIRVNISGEVQIPGIYSTSTKDSNKLSNTDGGESLIINNEGWPTVIEIIQKAGGLTTEADFRKIKLIRYNKLKNINEEIIIDFWDSIANGKPIRNYEVFDGDSIFVERALNLANFEKKKISKSNLSPSTITVNVIGEVVSPGETIVSANSPIIKAILNAGGFTRRANKSKITLLRLSLNGKIEKTTFINNKKKNNFYLKDRDVVYVKSNLLSKSTDNIKSIVEPLSPLINAATFYKVIFE